MTKVFDKRQIYYYILDCTKSGGIFVVLLIQVCRNMSKYVSMKIQITNNLIFKIMQSYACYMLLRKRKSGRSLSNIE